MAETIAKNSFIPKERDALPRILLLDFDEQCVTYLAEQGYTVFSGSSGFGQSAFALPKHYSEIEIILWDTSNLRDDHKIITAGGEYHINSPAGLRNQDRIVESLANYFQRVRRKGGFAGIFLGDRLTEGLHLVPDVVGRKFSFGNRPTSTLELNPYVQEDIWYEFYKRFVPEQSIRFSTQWNDNTVGLKRYFNDEDDNWYAVVFDYFSIIPKIEEVRKNEALIFLLQDIFPLTCSGENIFPDKYYYLWTNKNKYLPPKVQELKAENERIVAEADQQITDNKTAIDAEMTQSEYLSNMLIADDSNLFPEDKRLSVTVNKILEDDFGFTVTDVDEMRLQVGESLKEDKWIEDTDGFFALAEIKGTERGAKANWVRVDLNAHIKEFEVVKGISGLHSMLIFNHERRMDPEERSVAFSGDTDLIEYCKKSNIRLVPVYELFKMARDIKQGLLSKEEARKMLKEGTGLFAYTTTSPK